MTKETDNRLQFHADHIDALPFDLRKIYTRKGYWGKADLFRDKVRFFCNNEDLTIEQLKHLEKLCR